VFNYTKLATEECDFIEIASAEDLPAGERMFVDIDQFHLVVFNIAGGLYAISDVCSHDNGPVGEGELEEYEIACPRHGAHFDVRTGKVRSLPAIVDIPAYPVRVVDGKIEVGLPKE